MQGEVVAHVKVLEVSINQGIHDLQAVGEADIEIEKVAVASIKYHAAIQAVCASDLASLVAKVFVRKLYCVPRNCCRVVSISKFAVILLAVVLAVNHAAQRPVHEG